MNMLGRLSQHVPQRKKNHFALVCPHRSGNREHFISTFGGFSVWDFRRKIPRIYTDNPPKNIHGCQVANTWRVFKDRLCLALYECFGKLSKFLETPFDI